MYDKISTIVEYINQKTNHFHPEGRSSDLGLVKLRAARPLAVLPTDGETEPLICSGKARTVALVLRGR